MNHFVAIVVLSIGVATIFTLILKENREEQIRYFLQLLGYMVLGSFVASWLMYGIS